MIAAPCDLKEQVSAPPDCETRAVSLPVLSARPLAWFRIGLAGVLLVQALCLVGNLEALFGQHGVVAWSVLSAGRSPSVPTLAWLERAFTAVGVSRALVVPFTFALYVGALLGLLVGCRTRLTAAMAWFTNMTLMNSGEMSAYGVDQFARIGLFYCLWFPVGQAMSLDRSAGRVSAAPSFEAWLGLRILQVHVCTVYFTSGIAKALGEQWRNGEAIWRALMTMQGPVDCALLAMVPALAVALCWTTLLLEAGCVLFVWHPITRRLWLLGILGMHLGIAVLMNLWTFAAVMIVFDLSAFAVSAATTKTEGGRTAAGHRSQGRLVARGVRRTGAGVCRSG